MNPTDPPRMTESAIHRAFEVWLRAQTGLAYTTSRMDRASTIRRGDPDFFIFTGGRVLMIEIKTEKGRIARAQTERHAQLAACGCHVYVVRSIESAIELVTAWKETVPAYVRPPNPQEIHRFGGKEFIERDGRLIRVGEKPA